jgi:hypothetical protein
MPDLNQTFDVLKKINSEVDQWNEHGKTYSFEVEESTNKNIKLKLEVDIYLKDGFGGKYPYVHQINILGYTPDKGSEYTFKTHYTIIPPEYYYLNRLSMCKIVITNWGSWSKTLVGDLVIQDGGDHTEGQGTISINQAAEYKEKKGGNKKTKRGNKKRHNKTAKRRRRV